MSKTAQRYQSYYTLGCRHGESGKPNMRKGVPKRFNRAYAKGWHDGKRGLTRPQKGSVQAIRDYISRSMGQGAPS